MINIARHTVMGDINSAALMQEFKTRCEMRKLTRTLEEQNRILKNAGTRPAIKKGETSEPTLAGIPFLKGGRENFFKNLQTLTDAGIITTGNNRYIIHATNKAAAHRIIISIFADAITKGLVQNFFLKDENKKIKWSYLRDFFNYKTPGKNAAKFTHVELSIQFETYFSVYIANLDTDFHSEKTINSLICDEFKHVRTLTKNHKK